VDFPLVRPATLRARCWALDAQQVNDVNERELPPQTDLQIDLQVNPGADGTNGAVVIVVDGIPKSASMPALIATILGSLQLALGARLEARPSATAH
jgi:hypothetical protein